MQRTSSRLRFFSNNNRKTSRKKSTMKDDDQVFKPYEQTINALKEIPELNSPMKKMEFIYQIFNSLMVGEVDKFWQGVSADSRNLLMDYENLNGIAIYCALKTNIPILLVDIQFVELFVTKSVL